MSRRHRVVLFVAGLAVSVSVAACGAGASSYSASGSAGSPGSSGSNSGFLTFAVCMRANGVPNLPDPTGGGGIQLPNGVNPQSPAFQAAQAKCKHLLPGGGPPNGPPSAQAKLAVLKISECMRSHGVTGFPDPTTKLPSSPAGYGEVIDRGGVVLAVPNTINVRSPAYQQAAAACNFH